MRRVPSASLESPPISEKNRIEKFPPQFKFRLSCDTFFLFFLYITKNSIQRFYQVLYPIVDRAAGVDPTNHFQFSLYLGYKYNVSLPLPSLPFSPPLLPSLFFYIPFGDTEDR